MREHLAIFDTTLRDGLQTPYLPAIARDDRLRIALMLERMRVDVIEAGFPFSSPENAASVALIAERVTGSTICALAMATRETIDAAAEALAKAKRKRVHIFLGSSPLHLHKLGLTKEDAVARAVESITYAARFFGEIEFSPEDAGRADIDFLCNMVERAIAAGATVINIPDTVGYCMTEEFGARIRSLHERVPNADKVVWSVHCHDDFGCATANTLAGVRSGARQVEGTLYQLGERAGNAAWEEVVMAVSERRDFFPCDTRIDTTLFWEAARLVESITGVPIPPNKAVVGQNAFAHESGIHQAGVIKNPATYEVIPRAKVGWQGNSLPFGPQSGRNALRQRLQEVGITMSANAFEVMFTRVKDYADTHGQVSDTTLCAFAESLQVPAHAK